MMMIRELSTVINGDESTVMQYGCMKASDVTSCVDLGVELGGKEQVSKSIRVTDD